jgi:cytosine deaminase
LVRQFNIGVLVIGDSVNFDAGSEWLRQSGTKVIDLQSGECIEMMRDFISRFPELWNEDIGVSTGP